MDRLDHGFWKDVTLSKALKVVSSPLDIQPLLLSIDETMVKKEREKSELWLKSFDHDTHNGYNYLNGHCMVSFLLDYGRCEDDTIWEYREENIQFPATCMLFATLK